MIEFLTFIEGLEFLWFLEILIALILLRPLILWLFMIRRATRALERIADSLELMPAVQEHRRAQARTARAGRP